MTQQQQDLVADNHNLIYFVLHRLKHDIDDWYDICAIGLCKAAIAYKPQYGFKFSTFAVKYMKTEIYLEQRHRHRQLPAVSLSNYIAPDIEILLQDTIEDRNDLLGSVDLQLLTEDASLLNPREKKVLNLRIVGFKNKEIGAAVGTSQANASRILQVARRKIQNAYRCTE